ncbi:50S ribosomal protein L29 [Candidatus Woesebacteria bacterium]|nr:50S ribosomal protein L29 [Candidatus Woesebacteria bacterium]
MKRNDIRALQSKTKAELQTQLTGYERELATARLKKAVGKLENVSSIAILRDDIARVKTSIRRIELAA